MADHGITISVISFANLWLDFLPSDEAAAAAKRVNDEMKELCARCEGKSFAFGTIPLSGPPAAITAEIHRLRTLPHIRDVFMGTTGLGAGLDDPILDPIWAALESTSTLIFLHAHYGLPTSVYGARARDNGHVLPLALGFPLKRRLRTVECF